MHMFGFDQLKSETSIASFSLLLILLGTGLRGHWVKPKRLWTLRRWLRPRRTIQPTLDVARASHVTAFVKNPANFPAPPLCLCPDTGGASGGTRGTDGRLKSKFCYLSLCSTKTSLNSLYQQSLLVSEALRVYKVRKQ